MVENRTIHLSQVIVGYFIVAKSQRLAPGTLSDYDTTLGHGEQFLGFDPPLASITAGDSLKGGEVMPLSAVIVSRKKSISA